LQQAARLIAENHRCLVRQRRDVDADGKLFTVRYDEVNAMLLNEFLKGHRKLEEQPR
jgi:hypothetical protein